MNERYALYAFLVPPITHLDLSFNDYTRLGFVLVDRARLTTPLAKLDRTIAGDSPGGRVCSFLFAVGAFSRGLFDAA